MALTPEQQLVGKVLRLAASQMKPCDPPDEFLTLSANGFIRQKQNAVNESKPPKARPAHLAPRIARVQKDILLKFLQAHPQLLTRGKTSIDKENAENLWEELTVQLNCVPGGGNKDWRSWRRTWHDLHAGLKTKLEAAKRHAAGKGPAPTRLNAWETSISELLQETNNNNRDPLEIDVSHIQWDVSQFDTTSKDIPSLSYTAPSTSTTILTTEEISPIEVIHVNEFPEISTPPIKNKVKKTKFSVLRKKKRLMKAIERKNEMKMEFEEERIKYMKLKSVYLIEAMDSNIEKLKIEREKNVLLGRIASALEKQYE